MQTALTEPLPASWATPEVDCAVVSKCSVASRVATVALAITAIQVLACLLLAMLAQGIGPADAYRSFCRRDGFMYACILADGYRSTIPPTASINFSESNVAFFPGYPLLGRLVDQLSGGWLGAHASLVVAAQLAAWASWCYWLLMLRRLGASRPVTCAATLILSLHPASFFLVVAYSESLFLAAMLGFLFWLGADGWPARGVAIAHGLAMTSTRLGGLPVAFCPLAGELWPTYPQSSENRRAVTEIAASYLRNLCGRLRTISWLAAASLSASLGGLSFLAFCQWRFGAWNLYFQTQREGQGVAADWLWFVRPQSYAFLGSLFHEHLSWTDDLSRLSLLLTLLALAALFRIEWRIAGSGDASNHPRIVFYLIAVALLFLHAAGVSPRHMQSMLRYGLVVQVPLLLALVSLVETQGATWRNSLRTRPLIGLLLVLGLLQVTLIWRYFRGDWVA